MDTAQKIKRARELLGYRRWERELMCLRNIVHQSGRSGSSKGQQGLRAFAALGFTYLWLEVKCSFVECTKQASSKWLEICLFGQHVKQLDV